MTSIRRALGSPRVVPLATTRGRGGRWERRGVQLPVRALRSGWSNLWRCSGPSTLCRSLRGTPTGRERSTSTRSACGRTRTRGTSSGAEVCASASGSPSGLDGSGRRRKTVTSRSTSRTSPRNGQSLRPRASSSLARRLTRAFVIWRSSLIPMATTACCTVGTRREPDAGTAARPRLLRDVATRRPDKPISRDWYRKHPRQRSVTA